MKLADCALGQMLLRTRDVVALGQILDHLFAEPPTFEEPGLAVREAPLEVGDDAGIRRLLAKVVRVRDIDLSVGAPCGKWYQPHHALLDPIWQPLFGRGEGCSTYLAMALPSRCRHRVAHL